MVNNIKFVIQLYYIMEILLHTNTDIDIQNIYYVGLFNKLKHFAKFFLNTIVYNIDLIV